MKRTLIIFSLILCSLVAKGQSVADSLEAALKTDLSDEARKELELQTIEAYLNVNPKIAGRFMDSLQTKFESDQDPTRLIRFLIARSLNYRMQGQSQLGKEAAFRALEYANVHPDSIRFKSKIYNSLGAILDDESDVRGSIEYHLIALRYAESIDYQPQIATICAGVGRAYQYLGEFKTAQNYYERAIAIKLRRNEHDEHLARYYTNLSNGYDAEGKYDKSLEYLDKAIALKENLGMSSSVIPAFNNKAYTLYLMKDYAAAEKTIQYAIHLADSLDIDGERMYAYSTYAEILFAQNRVDKAEEYMAKSTTLSNKYKDYYLSQYNLDLLYNISYSKGDYKKALDYFKQKSVVLDSVRNGQIRGEIEALVLDYETEKKNNQIAVLNKENQLSSKELKKSRQLQMAFLIAAILAIAVILLLWSRHKNKVKTAALEQMAVEQGYEQKLIQAELQALRSQMNPHFLFNCLNSINGFIIKNQQELASDYLSKFSKLIRGVLNNSQLPRVELSKELETLMLYIELESLRFNAPFEYRIDIDAAVEADLIEVPPLLIQPFVENSIWHGLIHKKDAMGQLVISLRQDKDCLSCSIEDNGIGREAAQKLRSKRPEKRKSLGIAITTQRLQQINSEANINESVVIEDLFDSEGTPSGTRVTLKIAI